MSHYGIRGKAHDLLKSYLSDRSHCVKIQNSTSKYITLKHGVPQGSVVGPLFFILYINDLHKAIKNSKTIHFADDTSLVCQEKSLKKLNKKVNHDLKLLVHWLRANKISLNTAKTQIVLFKNKRKEIHKKLNFRLSGKKMSLSSHVTYLGITIEESLEWNFQFHGLLQKLSRSVGILAKLRYYLSYKSLLSVYYALFDSHVNFCVHTMGHVTLASLEKIEKLQNKALRIMHFKAQRDSSKPLYINSRILPIRKPY